MSLTYVTRPLSDRLWLRPDLRERSKFTASWGDTLWLLEQGIRLLDGTDVVIEADLNERDIRLDGMMRADARPASPAVAVAFESRFGPLIYRCDRYDQLPWAGNKPIMRGLWQHNVRAIAKTIEALRYVDNYGATQSGEQYRGFKAIGAGSGAAASGMTTDEAKRILFEWANLDGWPTLVEDRVKMLKTVKKATHPDVNEGNHAAWTLVQDAERHLTRAGALP